MQVFTLNIKPMVPVPQWEYTVLSANTDEEFVSLANNLGAQGWEMVNVRFSERTTPPFEVSLSPLSVEPLPMDSQRQHLRLCVT